MLVRIEACGLCHTNIHAAQGDWPIKPPAADPGPRGRGDRRGARDGDEISEGDRVAKAVKSSEVGPSQLCAIFGVGGLGHLAVEYAKIQGATVVAVDLEDDKLEMARELGADYVVNAAE